MKFNKNLLLILIFFIFSFMTKGEEKMNNVDYIGFYTKNDNYYARVGKYDDEELEYDNINSYCLDLGNKVYPIVLLDENDKADTSLINEFISLSIDEKGILKWLISFFHSPENNTSYFLRGEFYKKLFMGEVAVIFQEDLREDSQTYSVFLFRGIFFINSLVSGIDQEYKSVPIKLKRIHGITYMLDKYECVVTEKDSRIYNKKFYKLRNSKTPDKRNLEKIILEYKNKL